MKNKFSMFKLPEGYTSDSEFDYSISERLAEMQVTLEELYADFEFDKYFISEVTTVSTDYILTKRIKAILLQMTIRIYNIVCATKSQAYSILGIISQLFGLCSSQSSYIFHAFNGASLCRIPTI